MTLDMDHLGNSFLNYSDLPNVVIFLQWTMKIIIDYENHHWFLSGIKSVSTGNLSSSVVDKIIQNSDFHFKTWTSLMATNTVNYFP